MTDPTSAATPGARRDERPSLPARYRVVERIGSGGMADVYRADDELLGRQVAIKVFRDPESADDRRRQQAEARILARLSHPHLVTLFDAVLGTDGRGALILEWVDGSDLRSLLDRGALRSSAVAAIGTQICDALAYIHAHGVVHRDVSPGNMLLQGTPATGVTAKLTDLGIARFVDDGRVTTTGTVVGTAGYLSPEQAQGRLVEPPTDLYSLGLVLLECLTGRREFPGGAVESAAARLVRDPAIPAALPPRWADLLRAMTARDPAARPTAAEAGGALDGLRAIDMPAAAPSSAAAAASAPRAAAQMPVSAERTAVLAHIESPSLPSGRG